MSGHPYFPTTLQRRERLVNLADLRHAGATESEPSAGTPAPHPAPEAPGEEGAADLRAS